MKRSALFIAVLVLVLGCGLGGWWMSRSHKQIVQNPSIGGSMSSNHPIAAGGAGAASIASPAVTVPMPTVAPVMEPMPVGSDQQRAFKTAPEFAAYGQMPAVAGDSNQVAAVLKTFKQDPGMLSVIAKAEVFDPQAYALNPASWLGQPRPARAWQTAQPGPAVPILRAVGPLFYSLKQESSVALRVLAPIGAPVSFIALDGGLFDNGMTFISVAADERGVASVSYRATTGVINAAQVVAGGPLTSGQVTFRLDVQAPIPAHPILTDTTDPQPIPRKKEH